MPTPDLRKRAGSSRGSSGSIDNEVGLITAGARSTATRDVARAITGTITGTVSLPGSARDRHARLRPAQLSTAIIHNRRRGPVHDGDRLRSVDSTATILIPSSRERVGKYIEIHVVALQSHKRINTK